MTEEEIRTLEGLYYRALGDIDFTYITETMYKLDWKWVNYKEGGMYIPDGYDLKNTFYSLFQECINDLRKSEGIIATVATGGCEVTIVCNVLDDKKSGVFLSFVLEEGGARC